MRKVYLTFTWFKNNFKYTTQLQERHKLLCYPSSDIIVLSVCLATLLFLNYIFSPKHLRLASCSVAYVLQNMNYQCHNLTNSRESVLIWYSPRKTVCLFIVFQTSFSPLPETSRSHTAFTYSFSLLSLLASDTAPSLPSSYTTLAFLRAAICLALLHPHDPAEFILIW